MRILMLAPHPSVRGPIGKHTRLLVKGLEKLGCEVTLHGWGRRRDDEAGWERARGRLADALDVRKELRRLPYDVLLIKTAQHWPALSRDLLLFAVTRGRRPCTVLQFHGSTPDLLRERRQYLSRLGYGVLLTMSDGVLVLSSDEVEGWRRFRPDILCRVVSNPFVSQAPLANEPPRLPVESPQHAPVILMVARLRRDKGLFELADALPLVLARHSVHLLLVGDGPDRSAFEETIRRRGITPYVTLAGYLEGEALQAAYRVSDLFVLPSYAEGFPTVIAEAMDAGLPIVTTGIFGMAEHLRHEESALFVRPREADGLAAALNRLLDDPALAKRIGAAARQRVRAFSPEIVSRGFLDVLQDFAARRAAKI